MEALLWLMSSLEPVVDGGRRSSSEGSYKSSTQLTGNLVVRIIAAQNNQLMYGECVPHVGSAAGVRA